VSGFESVVVSVPLCVMAERERVCVCERERAVKIDSIPQWKVGAETFVYFWSLQLVLLFLQEKEDSPVKGSDLSSLTRPPTD